MQKSVPVKQINALLLLICLTPVTPFEAQASGSSCAAIFSSQLESSVSRTQHSASDWQFQNSHINKNSFEVGRGLNHYNKIFHNNRRESSANLLDEVRSLPRGSIVFDMGAGTGKSLMDALSENPGLTVIGVAYKQPDTLADGWKEAQAQSKAEYIDGDYVENMIEQGRLGRFEGRATFAWDVYGVASYSRDLRRVLNIDLSLLGEKGALFFNLMTKAVYGGSEPIVKIVVRDLSGVALSVEDAITAWVGSSNGISLERVSEIQPAPVGDYEASIGFKIIKTEKNAEFADIFTPVLYTDGSPPVREYRLELTEPQWREAIQRAKERKQTSGNSLSDR